MNIIGSNPQKERQKAISALKREANAIVAERSEHDWDGYDAKPIPQDAAMRAIELLKFVPLDMPLPELSPCPTGDLALDWYNGETMGVTVSLSAYGMVRWAGAVIDEDGPARSFHGKAMLHLTIPEELLSVLRRHMKKEEKQ